jgi:hypothetical protein
MTVTNAICCYHYRFTTAINPQRTTWGTPRRHPKDPKAITTVSPFSVAGTVARIGKLHVTPLNTRAKDGGTK